MVKWLSVLWSVDSKVMVSFTEPAGQLMRILQINSEIFTPVQSSL